MEKNKFTFIDLFSGIGGFHQAMDKLGGVCVGYSEIDSFCIDTYEKNFEDVISLGDINKIESKELPNFDVVCGGFPCQPFSKAGKRLGFDDETRGQLFYRIVDILKEKPKTKYILLENVRNLADHSDNWNAIVEELKNCDFIITENPIILSPSDFGIPQNRERVYILGIKKEYANSELIKRGSITEADLKINRTSCEKNAALDVLDFQDSDNEKLVIDAELENAINAWEEFRLNINGKVSSPIWSHYFGIDYTEESEYEKSIDFSNMPRWKQNIVSRNRNLYLNNKTFIDEWMKKNEISGKSKLLKKFEWNCGDDVDSIKNGIIQIRQSGIRVKRPNCYPALVAMTTTPIIWDKVLGHYRSISIKEAAKLQSFKEDFDFGDNRKQSYKQLGNAVNTEVVRTLAERLFALSEEEKNDRPNASTNY